MSGIAPGMMPNGMPLHMNPALMSSNQVPEEPPAKRAKIEESIPSLIPEEIFFRDQPKVINILSATTHSNRPISLFKFSFLSLMAKASGICKGKCYQFLLI